MPDLSARDLIAATVAEIGPHATPARIAGRLLDALGEAGYSVTSTIPDWADMIGDTVLIAFVRARLVEDEAGARAAGGGSWRVQHSGCDAECPAPCPDQGKCHSRDMTNLETGETHCTCQLVEGDDICIYAEGGHDEDQAEHIARYDPARALREVEIKHAHLGQYLQLVTARQLDSGPRSAELDAARATAWGAVLADASAWSDHPDYLEKWRIA